MEDFQNSMARSAWRANAIGFGAVWAIAGLAWAGALGWSLALGFFVGAIVGVLGASVNVFRGASSLELVESATSSSWFGAAATVVGLIGLVVWVVS